MTSKNRTVSAAVRAAQTHNWNKAILTGMSKQLYEIAKDPKLTAADVRTLLQAGVLIRDVLFAWRKK